PYCYVAMLGGGLELVDVTDPTRPHRVGAYDAGGNVTDVAVSGHYALVAADSPDGAGTNSLAVLDVADPANPPRVGTYFGSFGSVTGVALSGSVAYVAGLLGLEAIDLSDPTDPQRVGGNSAIVAFNAIQQAVVAGGRVFIVASEEQGLNILEGFRAF